MCMRLVERAVERSALIMMQESTLGFIVRSFSVMWGQVILLWDRNQLQSSRRTDG